jgi:transposase
MSLPPPKLYSIPAQTQRVARAAFPKGRLCLRLSDELGTLFEGQDFADLFPPQGQPALAPFRLALITVLQFVEGLSDRAAADAVRGRIDGKYLLCLELDDPGFDFSVLCEFRARLVEQGAERRLFERLLARLRERQLVKARGQQRTDSTHVLACVRDLNRLERGIETLRAALNALATAVPGWVRLQVPASWVDAYGQRTDERRLPATEKEREQRAEAVGRDGYTLLDALDRPESPVWLRTIPALETLRQVWIQSFVPVLNGGPRWR